MSLSVCCVDHAMQEQLVRAVGVAGGRSVCAEHTDAAHVVPPALAMDGRAPTCLSCRATPHRAYFVVAGEPLCIRHAADAAFAGDDMGAHDMVHAAYLQLHRSGVRDAY